nr:GNAT family N-acetyltransferase [Lactobacillus johnsonii]
MWDVVNLQVKENQKKYIATNTVSLLEAYATKNENERVETFAVYEKDILVGFIMINFNVFNWDGAPRVACNNYCIWRFMIDQRYQGKGLGKKALNKLIEYIRTKPLGESKKIYLSYVPGNDWAEKLYKEAEFVSNGEKDGEEIVLVLDLSGENNDR